MLKQNLSLRLTGPTIFVSLLLFGLCTAGAIFLSRQQAITSAILTENVGSRKAAYKLEGTLRDVIQLLKNGSIQVDALHDVIGDQLVEAKRFADKEEERKLVAQLAESFARYQQQWQAHRDSNPA